MNFNHLNTIKKLVKDNKIKSITCDDIIYDFRSIDKLNDNKNIYISNKYIPVLVSNGVPIKEAIEYLKEKPHCYTINKKGKFISFKVTHHSALALARRFTYLYLQYIEDSLKYEIGENINKLFDNYGVEILNILKENNVFAQNIMNIFYTQTILKQKKDNLKFEVGVRLNKLFDKYGVEILNILKENNDNIGNNPIIHNLVTDLMNDAQPFTAKQMSRIRDRRAFKERNKKHGASIKYFSHPFLLIIENSILVTSELYADSEDFRHINKFTKSNNINNELLRMFNENLNKCILSSINTSISNENHLREQIH